MTSSFASDCIPGIYQHFKGKYYEVLSAGRHSETLERMVIYQALYDDFGMWVRPLIMFLECVEIDYIKYPRFKFITNQTKDEFLKDLSNRSACDAMSLKL